MMKNLTSIDTALPKGSKGTVPDLPTEQSEVVESGLSPQMDVKGVSGLSTKGYEIRALLYKLASVGFLYPERLWKERMAALIEEFNHADFAPEPKEIKDISASLSKDDSLEELQREHFRLFGPDPLCPLEITHWTKNGVFMQSRQMADMAGFYRAFGMDIDEGARVDNFSVAFEFLSYLSIKILHASEEGNDNHIKITESAMDKFRNEFVLPALERFVKSLKKMGQSDFYASLGELAERI